VCEKLSGSTNLNYDELNREIEERGNRIQQKFGKEALRGIEDPKLSEILTIIRNKRRDTFRPALTSLSCEAVGGSAQDADDAGLIFALVSTGVSIHDDIIDKSPRKHLRVTILGKYGLNKSLLVGDLLIVKGWSKISGMLERSMNPKKIAKVANLYGDFCTEMCEAEFMENSCKKQLDTDLEYHLKILWKAMAETEACTRIGAILGNGANSEVQALAKFGRRLGFTSRLADEVKDTLNIDGSFAHRLKYESVPLPLVFAATSSKDARLRIESIIKKRSMSSSNLRELLEICFDSNAFSYVERIAEKNVKSAASCLDAVKPSAPRDFLLELNEKIYDGITSLF
jgi:geranylgeranyl diphosphate synthase type I